MYAGDAVLLLIDSHEPALPPPECEPERPRGWPTVLLALTWRLLLGLGLVLLSGLFPPLEAYAVLLAACVLIGRGLGAVVQSTPGLRDHRQ